MLLTIERVRLIGRIVGVACILAGLLIFLLMVFSFPPFSKVWVQQHMIASSIFILLVGDGIILIGACFPYFFRRPEDLAEKASAAGYEVSEKTVGRYRDGIRHMIMGWIILVPAYTLFWAFYVSYSNVEASINPDYAGGFTWLTWSFPVTAIIGLSVLYYFILRYTDVRELFTEARKGSKLVEKKKRSENQ